ncbi:MAG: hypothetical protein EXX96DRAFT_61221 [Benjaminiella poitrasii]|nr:MAG: hypothetical protein EXX96DRAFT_61221 [Benjaminiella poitrasii]
MSGFPTIRNPLLASPPTKPKRREFSRPKILSTLSITTTATFTSSISTASIRGLMSQTMHQISSASSTLRLSSGKRIVPVAASNLDKAIMQKSMSEKNASLKRFMSETQIKKLTPSLAEKEPIVHYNGSSHTLESLPKEKLDWIKNEQNTFSSENPLTNYSQSIVLRKPLSRCRTFPIIPPSVNKPLPKPKSTFYLRILQVVATDTSKSRLFRCSVQINQETFLSSYVTSEKKGKHSSVAQFDETFLFDVEEETTATVRVFTQNKSSSFFLSRQNQKEEVFLGQKIMKINLKPESKKAQRIELNSDPSSRQSNDLQLLIVHGTFVSNRAQHMMNKTILFEDFITIHAQAGLSARWDRFWGVLRSTQFELYDFEYKEVKKKKKRKKKKEKKIALNSIYALTYRDDHRYI